MFKIFSKFFKFRESFEKMYSCSGAFRHFRKINFKNKLKRQPIPQKREYKVAVVKKIYVKDIAAVNLSKNY